jgi:hypothetical protein
MIKPVLVTPSFLPLDDFSSMIGPPVDMTETPDWIGSGESTHYLMS